MAERIRFYTDEHIPKAVTMGLRRRGVDVLTCQEVGMLSVDDGVHLALATREGRTAIAQDEDFLRLHASGFQHQGIVYSHRQTPVGEVIRGVMLVYEVLEDGDMTNHVEFL